jgi:hypothetical protein
MMEPAEKDGQRLQGHLSMYLSIPCMHMHERTAYTPEPGRAYTETTGHLLSCYQYLLRAFAAKHAALLGSGTTATHIYACS